MSQLNMLHIDTLMQKDLRTFLKAFGILGSQITTRTALCYLLFDVNMSAKIALKTSCNIFTLRDNPHSWCHILNDFRHQNGVVCAAKYNSIYRRITSHEVVNTLLYKVIGTRTIGFIVFN